MCWVFLICIRFWSRNLHRINLRSFAQLSTFPSRGANEATTHYSTVEHRVFGGLGFRVYARSKTVLNLRYATCPNHPNLFGIIFDSGILDLGSGPESKMIPK